MVTEGFREPLINLCFKKEQTFESPHIRDSKTVLDSGTATFTHKK